FDVGSARLGREARGTAARVAESFGRLAAGAAGIGVRPAVELVGRSDPTGSDSTNQALSQDRAGAVLAALVVRGLPAGSARVRAAGTSRPLEAADSAERARINRSVSFVVSLDWQATRREPSR
ncbi:MAG: OmpA family protein, partial [Gemmatimonadales bacterium]